MSVLRNGDQHLHYSDSSHRWLCPEPGGDEEAWVERVRMHVEEHRISLGGLPMRQRRNHVERGACPG